MKLLLQRNIQNLGKLGDVVDVADGYGRNYLLPKGYGVELTDDNLHRFEQKKRRLIAQEQETIQNYQVLAKELEKTSCTIIANSTEEGHLYGSVTARDIAQNFAAEDLNVPLDAVLLDEPIKKLGIYKVRVRLHPEVECEAKVWVVKGDDRGKPASSAELDEDDAEDEYGDED